jgi:DNA (cytosine-5)-methyltransferase 1
MYKSVSLFTGAGGLDLGLHAAGFTVCAAIESDRQCIETISHPNNSAWWDKTKLFATPIESVSSESLASLFPNKDLTLLAGGPPCQPFSKSGYWHRGDSKRLTDPRANTLSEYLRVLSDLQPTVFLLENVPGLAFSQKQEGMEYLRSQIEKINRKKGSNYSFSAAQLNAARFGVPQARERVFVIGHREGKTFEFPEPTHYLDESEISSHAQERKLIKFVTAWDALSKVKTGDTQELRVRGKWADLLPSIPEGKNYLHHTARGEGEEIFGWRTRYWSMLLKLAKSKPSWTLTAQPGPAIGPFHWENRRLSADELCALQTFPKGYHIEGSVLSAHKQLGNAVPSLLAQILGREILKQFFGASIRGEPSLAISRSRKTPNPHPVAPVPEKFMNLVARYQPHPGSGLGPGATGRNPK